MIRYSVAARRRQPVRSALETIDRVQAAAWREEMAQIAEQLGTGTLERTTSRRSAGDVVFFDQLRAALRDAPRASWRRLSIAFNEDQVESKLWLLDTLPAMGDLAGQRVVILGAWFGFLAMMLEKLAPHPPGETTCVDIDAAVCDVATDLLRVLRHPVHVLQADMRTLDHAALATGMPTMFVNTSCEHIANFAEWRARVPAGARLVLQSNNHLGCSEHVNCVPDLAAFEQQAALSKTAYAGALQLRHFTRFMVMGTA